MSYHDRLKSIVQAVIALALIMGAGATEVSARKAKRDINKVRQEQQATKKEIKETSRKITVNTRETQLQLNRLSTLSDEISAKRTEIGRMQLGVDSIDRKITQLNDSLGALTGRLESMRENYVKQLRKVQASRGAMNTLSFVFSSESFGRAWQRVRYLKQFDKWRKRRAAQIRLVTDSLNHRKQELDNVHSSRVSAIARLELAQKQLQSKRDETDKIVASLKNEGESLKALLKEKEKRAKALDGELDKLIAEEQRREAQRRKEAAKKAAASKKEQAAAKKAGKTPPPAKPEPATAIAEADRKLNGNFESNKGQLLFPVSGRYRVVRGFGRQKHPELEHVETENSGIDVEAVGGGVARAVFEGRVSEIFRQPGYNTIVMVRHGNFLTIYANLSSINVKKGDVVTAGQTIGTIYPDPDEDGRSILHFELRKERTKLNPLQWVK